jgi:hypothetical protein
MDPNDLTGKKTFSYDEARALLPQVRRLTEEAFRKAEAAGAAAAAGHGATEAQEQFDRAVSDWGRAVTGLGAEVKGLWLVDFDNGSGYYCWRYPEEGLLYFHSYEDGFRGRIRIQ